MWYETSADPGSRKMSGAAGASAYYMEVYTATYLETSHRNIKFEMYS